MVDVPQVSSLVALSKLDTANIPSAYLNLAGRSGSFVWFGGNFATAVTNDPAQGIYVAPVTDTTGASGAWIRQWTGRMSLGWWGVVGDAIFSGVFPPVPYGPATVVSGTDNGPALANFGCFARYWSLTLGLPIEIDVPPPTKMGYVFDGGNISVNGNFSVYWACGIKNLDWNGHGTYWQNTTLTVGGYPWPVLTLPLEDNRISPIVVFSWLINKTFVGAYGFSMLAINGNLITTGNFVVGASYKIYTPGTTNWTSIGSANNTAGTIFIATGVGSGTGVAIEIYTYPNGSTSDGATFPGGILITAGNYISNRSYTIYSTGTTDFTLIGAADSNPGTTFIATGPGSGTGVATPVGIYPGSTCLVTSLDTQYGGYPPNPDQFDYLSITSITQYPASSSPTTITYTASTGALVAVYPTAPFGATVGVALNGIAVPISGITGTGGGVASLNGTWPILNTASAGTSITFQVPTGLTASALSGGVIGSVNIVTTSQPIRYQHLPTYPDFALETGGYACGMARVWSLTTGPWTINDGNGVGHVYPALSFDIVHRWRGVNLGASSWWTGSNTNFENAWTMGGLDVETYDFQGGGFVESVWYKIKHTNPTFLYPGETDKIGDTLYYKGLRVRNQIGPFNIFNTITYQSSFNSIFQEDCEVPSIATGNAKQWTSINCRYGALSLFQRLGFSTSQKFINCWIGNMQGQGILTDGSGVGTIDNSTNVFYGTAASGVVGANPPVSLVGVITLVKAALAGNYAPFAMYPGASLCLAGTQGVYTGSSVNAVSGDGYVTALTEDNLCIYFQTTLPYATLPAWVPATNNLYEWRNRGATFENCTGCDTARQCSAAYKKGLDYWEYKPFHFWGNYGVQRTILGIFGTLTRMILTPIKVGGAANAAVTLVLTTYDSSNNFLADSGGTTIKVVVGLFGVRDITLTSFLGQQAGDAITCNGSSSSFLPTNRVVAGFNGAVATFNFANTGSPTAEFIAELFFDTGQTVRKQITSQYDESGRLADLFTLAGSAP